MESWYVIQTKVRQEKVAEENLVRQGYHCFLPFARQWRKQRGKRVQTEEAFFSGYLFVCLDIDVVDIAPIRSTRGVLKIVRFDSLVSVPYLIVQDLQNRVDVNNFIDMSGFDFKLGQIVKIEGGALAGLRAIFQAKTGLDRAFLLLNMLGGVQKIEVPMAVLES